MRSGSFGHQTGSMRAISKRFGIMGGIRSRSSGATSGLAAGGGRYASTQLVREDIRDLTQIQQIDQMEVLVQRLSRQSGRQLVYGNLAREVRVSADTIRRWVAALCDFHLGFLVRPWFRNVSRSLRKEPKWYLRDWADIEDVGEKAETFVACHLLKAVDGWNDMGLGRFELGYLRDREKARSGLPGGPRRDAPGSSPR